MYREIEGDLIDLLQKGMFDAGVHGCNCFCTMKRGIAPLMAKAFGCNTYSLENDGYRGDINKLGQIDYQISFNTEKPHGVAIINAYTQYNFNSNSNIPPINYQALILCLQKINHIFKGQKIGLPKIGAGLAGGNWDIIKHSIKYELRDCDVTVVTLPS